MTTIQYHSQTVKIIYSHIELAATRLTRNRKHAHHNQFSEFTRENSSYTPLTLKCIHLRMAIRIIAIPNWRTVPYTSTQYFLIHAHAPLVLQLAMRACSYNYTDHTCARELAI